MTENDENVSTLVCSVLSTAFAGGILFSGLSLSPNSTGTMVCFFISFYFLTALLAAGFKVSYPI